MEIRVLLWLGEGSRAQGILRAFLLCFFIYIYPVLYMGTFWSEEHGAKDKTGCG